MKVSEVMTARPQTIAPDDSLRRAAELMDQLDVVRCPYARVEGWSASSPIATSRCVRLRSAIQPDLTPVADIMTDNIRYVQLEDNTDIAEELMASAQIRRLPVLDAERRLVGMVSLVDLAVAGDRGIGATLEQISQPGYPDR